MRQAPYNPSELVKHPVLRPRPGPAVRPPGSLDPIRPVLPIILLTVTVRLVFWFRAASAVILL
jgi:hypothetical protein